MARDLRGAGINSRTPLEPPDVRLWTVSTVYTQRLNVGAQQFLYHDSFRGCRSQQRWGSWPVHFNGPTSRISQHDMLLVPAYWKDV